MSYTYKIRNWVNLYETHETRKIKALQWVPIPNKHDGLGYRRVMAQPDAGDLLTAWHLMVQVSSKGAPEERGKLVRDGEPLTADDLAIMTGFPASKFERAFEFFCQKKQAWLEIDEISQQYQESPGTPGPSPGMAGSSPGTAGSSPGTTPLNGMEGMEGREDSVAAVAAPSPRSTKQDPEAPRDRMTASELADLFNGWASRTNCPTVTVPLNAERQRKATVRLRHRPKREYWQRVLDLAGTADFLLGSNDRGWRLTFDFLVANDKNAEKIVEGVYGRAKAPPPTRVRPSAQSELERLAELERTAGAA